MLAEGPCIVILHSGVYSKKALQDLWQGTGGFQSLLSAPTTYNPIAFSAILNCYPTNPQNIIKYNIILSHQLLMTVLVIYAVCNKLPQKLVA